METLQHSHDVLALAYRPDGKLLASATLDGQIYLWDPQEAQLLVRALTTITHAMTHTIRHVESFFPLTNDIGHAVYQTHGVTVSLDKQHWTCSLIAAASVQAIAKRYSMHHHIL